MKIKNVYTNKPLVVTPISERFYELAEDIQIYVQTDEGRMLYELKKGVRTNFRSGCAGVDLFVDHIGNVNTQLAYLVHDMNYCILPSEWHPVSKKYADNLLEQMLIYAGHSKISSWAVKKAVSLFGDSAYEEIDETARHNKGLFTFQWLDR